MINDVITSLRANLYSRVTSPLSGVFLISWATWNYRLLFVLFSSDSNADKFEYIDTKHFVEPWSWFTIGMLFPAVTAAAVIFGYPWPAQYVFKFWRERQKKLQEIRQEIEDETPLTVQQSKEIREEMSKLVGTYESELKARDSQISVLKSANEDVDKELSALKRAHRDLEGVMSDLSSTDSVDSIPNAGDKREGITAGDLLILETIEKAPTRAISAAKLAKTLSRDRSEVTGRMLFLKGIGFLELLKNGDELLAALTLGGSVFYREQLKKIMPEKVISNFELDKDSPSLGGADEADKSHQSSRSNDADWNS